MLKNKIGEHGFFMINKKITEIVGFEPSLMFAVLLDANSLFGEEFTQTVDQIEHLSCGVLTKRKQQSCIKTLESVELISCEYKGLPKQRHFRINKDALKSILINKK